MYKHVFVCLIVLLWISWLPLSAAQADGQTVLLQGKGKIWAQGAGLLDLKAKGMAELDGHGLEMLLIHNVSKTKIKIQGTCKIIPLPGEDALLVLKLKGNVVLKGDKIKFQSLGGKVTLKAAGHGVVWLKGLGFFKIGNNPEHKWPLQKVHKFLY